MWQFPLSFTHPAALWLLPLLPLLYIIARKSLVALSPTRRWLALALRALILLLLIFSLGGAQWVRFSEKLCVLFLVDGSDSARADLDKSILDSIAASVETMTPQDLAGVIVFGEDAAVEMSPAVKPAFQKFTAVVSQRRTDLSRALRLASGLFPEDAEKRIILFTDGNQNVGSAEQEVRMASAGGIAIDVHPIERQIAGETLVERVQVPDREDVDKPFDIKITVDTTSPGPATLRLYRDGPFVAKQEVMLREGKNIFTIQHSEKDSGFHTYEARIESLRDTTPDNNHAAAFSLIAGKPRILIVGEPEDARFISNALKVDNIPVEAAPSPPIAAAQAQNYDAIFLANIPANQLSEEQMKVLNVYVRDMGGGLAMIGGEDSFGVGGYAKTPVEEALPVNMELKDKMQFPSLALAMAIDKSGSMSMGTHGETKVKLACAAAARAIEMMTPRDRVGVVTFDSAGKWVQPMTDVKNRSVIIDRIFSIAAGGGTAMYPALEMAADALEAEKAQIKHIIALTDGMTAPGDWDHIIRRMKAANITLSTVGVGPDADKKLLEELARMGNGKFYATIDPRDTPRIFTKETVRVQRSYLIEQPFVPAVSQSHEILKGIGALPPLKGFVATEQKPNSELILRSTVKDHTAPILAVWQYGLGKSLAFASDAKNRWASEWVEWTGFNKFWPQCARWVMRNARQGALHPRVTVEGSKGKIVVDAVNEGDEQFINFLDLGANVVTPDFETLRVPLRQTGPGRYEGDFDAAKDGAFIATVTGGKQPPATAGFVVSYPPEYRDLKSNHYLMKQIAEATAGRIAPALPEWFKHRGHGVRSPQDIWYPLAWLALLLIPLDIGVRRVRLDTEHWEVVWRFVEKLIPMIGFRRRTFSDERMAALKASKRRARARIGEAPSQSEAAAPGELAGLATVTGADTPVKPATKAARKEQKEQKETAATAAAAAAPYIRGDVAKRLSMGEGASGTSEASNASEVSSASAVLAASPPPLPKEDNSAAAQEPTIEQAATNRLLAARARARGKMGKK
ncbi:MAG: VWA domain-containing protein [Candidatus Sumerlaeota bacterium]|nr:VWA domain-containing protein [Candidatus Sumerlaeota bacterium]